MLDIMTYTMISMNRFLKKNIALQIEKVANSISNFFMLYQNRNQHFNAL